MRGKKIDVNFIGEFVANCALTNKSSSEDICQEAIKQVADIDLEIKRVEELKILRSKLTDVIFTFNKTQKDNSKEKRNLSFYEIKNKDLSSIICKFVPSEINLLISHIECEKSEIMFTIKQLLEINILNRNNNILDKGSSFNDYKKFLVNYG